MYGRRCNCSEGFVNKDLSPELPCEDVDECKYDYCGFGDCSNTAGNFTCTCSANFKQGEDKQQCRECEKGFQLQTRSSSKIEYTLQETNGCSIRSIDENSVIYETKYYKYYNDSKCRAQFKCPDDQAIQYSIEKFDIEKEKFCNYDSLVINGKKYCNGYEPPMNGTLESGIVEFESDERQVGRSVSNILDDSIWSDRAREHFHG